MTESRKDIVGLLLLEACGFKLEGLYCKLRVDRRKIEHYLTPAL